MAGRKRKSEVNEVFEVKKQEARLEKMEKGEEDAPTPPPLSGVVDDMGAPEEPAEERFEPEGKAAEETPGTSETDLVKELTQILKVPKGRDSIMVFSMYSSSEFSRRYFLLDVDGIAYRKAWAKYKEITGTNDPVRFLEIVYRILNTDLPRLHRNVDWVPLN